MKRGTKASEQKSRDEALHDLRNEAVECRELGHAWSTQRFTLNDNETLIVRRLICTRCECLRVESYVRRSGELEHRTYEYPPGYRVEGVGRLYGTELRLELVNRWREKRWRRRR